jgi:two-component system sensor histidine kinase KdpD
MSLALLATFGLLVIVTIAWWRARTRADEERALRARLLSAAAHDIRSPLMVISATVVTLRDKVSDEVRASLDKILEETQRLGRKLENRVAAARLTSGREVPREWVSIEELVGATLARHDAALGERSVGLAIDDDAVAHVDPVFGELLLSNLVDNALRYTGASGRIDISARRGKNEVVMEVADVGPGISAEAQLETQLERGTGLAVCRAIAVAYGGGLEVIARDGGGTIARVRIADREPMPRLDRTLVEAR